jgi:hypothetical protein
MNTTNPVDKHSFISLRPYTLKELCALYGVCRYTFNKWLKPFEKEIGVRQGFYYSILQVKIIFDKLGYPSMYDFETKMVA